ncbi:hypothetical protein [Limibacillus halophilus]|uniref:Uncharacterized protein n=1 Tax=Limibacillus halophilus TaxID=1579333 RepID=A0A839SVD6_9PROT|nr:hypothetical protein [Limibacillus halophilus]MBB3065989.1 hypothetical protein [Limibacillus halophilus]
MSKLNRGLGRKIDRVLYLESIKRSGLPAAPHLHGMLEIAPE